MRRILMGLAAFALVLAVLLGAGWRFLHSDAGNRWLVERAVAASGGALAVEGLQGQLEESLAARTVTWAQEGLRVEVEDVAVRGEVSLWPLEVTLADVSAGSVRLIREPVATESPEQTAWSETLEGLVSPVPIQVDRWELGTVELVDTGGSRRLLDSASGSLRWSDTFALSSLAWEAPDVSGEGSLELELQPPFRHALDLDATVPGLTRMPAVRLALAGTADETAFTVIAEGQDRLALEGAMERPLENPGLRLTVTSERIEAAAGVVLAPLVLRLSGPLDALEVDGEGVLLAEGIPASPWTARGRLEDGSTLRLESLVLEAGERNYVVEAVASLLPGRLHVEPLVVATEDGETRLAGDLHLDLETEQIEADLTWTGLAWPLEGGEGAWRSPRGRVTAQGATSAWSGVAELEFLAPGMPGPGTFSLDAEGDLEGSRFRLGGAGGFFDGIEGQGDVDWSGALRFAWEGAVTGLDLAPLVNGWPSSIDARLGYFLESGGQAVRLDSLGGTLRGAPLSGQGAVSENGGRWSFDALRVQVGEASFSLDGAWPADRLILETHMPPGSAPALWLGLDATGTASVDGSVEPLVLEARLAGSGLVTDAVTVGAWSLEGNSAGDGLLLEALLPGVEASADGRVSASVRSSIRGIDADARLDQGALALALAIETEPIAWGDEPSLEQLDVSGRLVELVVLQDEEAVFTLDAPTTFRVAESEFSLSGACGRVMGGGAACLGGIADAGGALSVDGTLESVPLAPLARRLGATIIPDQQLDGTFSLRRSPGTLPTGLLLLELSPGVLRDPEDPDTTLETGPASLDLSLEEGEVRSGLFELPLPGVGRISGSLEASDVRLDGSGSLRGKVRFDVADLGPLGLLAPDLERLSGGMNLEVDLTGTLSEPFIDGLVRLEDVAFAVPYLGLTVTDLNGEGYARGQGEAALQADFRVGEGTGRLLGDVDLTPGQGRPFIFRIEGENLRLVETPDIELDANPAFDLSWSRDTWTIDGQLEIPRLRLTPRSTLLGQVSESEDVVIVAGEDPMTLPPPPYAGSRFFGQLELLLGDDITLETDKAQAQVGGGVTLNWNGPPEPTADGALTVQGEIAIFGPVLRVEDGNLRFPGVPIGNPELDLRAERDVFGNTQIRSAGVAIGGTARRPTIEAYTRPFTTRDRAWALLITGQDFDQGQGISALEVGAYVAPKIYVSYGLSLFDDENVASIRYDFRRGLGIKASSGERQSGVDISYTIESD